MLSLARRLPSRWPSKSPPSLRPSSSSSSTVIHRSPCAPPPISRPQRPTIKPLQNLPPLLLLVRPFFSGSSPLSSPEASPPPSPPLPPFSSFRGGCYSDDDDDADRSPPHLLPLCPGCGVHMQSSDPSLPGFFSFPSPKSPDYRAPIDRQPLVADDARISASLKSGIICLQDEADGCPSSPPLASAPKPVVCARCHSLRHYGRVKAPSAENLLPDFDFDRMVGPKMVSPSGPRSVVLMVVDAADFDGSFPRKVARLVSSAIERNSTAWKEGRPGNVPRVVLVVTKIDLLPSSVCPDELEDWVRKRARVGGTNKLTGLHMVSAVRNWGVRNLVEHVAELAGPRGNVWAVGAQNAGKSTLLNAMGGCTGDKVSHLTEAPVPGTTLGIIRVEGVLSGQAKLFDTPGILHAYQITSRLTREEQKLVHISKELRPRTYRIKAGHTVHIGGLMRLDIKESSVDSIYVTVWASPLLPLHMGKTETASSMMKNHFGHQLQPPIGEKRTSELGSWVRKEFTISGNSWNTSSMDVATAGLGWFAFGLKGEATVDVWTYEGINVVLRNSLILKRASIFEEAGFTVSKIVSQADSQANKLRNNEKKVVGSKGKPHAGPLELVDSALLSSKSLGENMNSLRDMFSVCTKE